MTTQPSTAAPDTPAGLRAQIFELVERYCAAVHPPPQFRADRPVVPVAGRVFDSTDVKSLVDSALEFWLTAGRFNAAFETRLAALLGRKHVLTVNSGSSANLVALAALTSPLLGDRALRPGDEVITTATGFPTTVNPALLYGMVPVFVDVDIPTYNIDATQIEAAIGPRTRAIMLAHTLGNPFDLDRITAIAKRHDLFLIEDCCDALGSTYRGQPVGSFGDIGTVSFYPAHHITMGEGGALFMNRSRLHRAALSIRDWGRDCYCAPGADNTCGHRFEWQLGQLPAGYDHKYIYSHLGFNLKITDMQAAVGLSQLDHLPGFMAARRRNFEALRHGLGDLEDILILPEATRHSDPCWFGFPLTVRETAPFRRDDLVLALNRAGIGTRLLFGGNLLRQPYMQGHETRSVGDLPNSDRVMRQTFWIGVYPAITPRHIEHMVGTIARFCRGL